MTGNSRPKKVADPIQKESRTAEYDLVKVIEGGSAFLFGAKADFVQMPG